MNGSVLTPPGTCCSSSSAAWGDMQCYGSDQLFSVDNEWRIDTTTFRNTTEM